VTGTGLNLLSLGLTGFVYETLFGRTGTALQVARFELLAVPGLASIPVIGPAFFLQPATAYLAYALVLAITLVLGRTGLGLRLRAAGEEPRAVEAAGVSVARLRTGAAIVAGALAGMGGAALAIGHAGTFAEGMTAGRGFIALAIVISARRNAIGALAASVVFGLLLSLQFEVQAMGTAVPYQVVRMAPYLGTIVLLALAPRARAG
jgi:simple sugar transport system permease protein